MVDAMEAVGAADPAPRHRPSPRQSFWPRRVATGTASFDKGAWRLLSGMIALVHQGEMLIPAGPAATFRRMMGGSSGVACTVHGHHLLAGEPCADSGLIAVLIDIRELGDRSS